MNMEKRENFETPEQQEKRARKKLRTGALLKAAVLAGLFVFIVPAGGPWMSQEAFTSIMGRIVHPNPLIDFVGHFGLCLFYGWIIATCIYSPPLGWGIIFGSLLAFPLCALNYVIFGLLGNYAANELHVGISHFVFCLTFSVAYRAMAVSKPRRKIPSTSEPVSRES